MSTESRPVEHRLYRFLCLTPWYAPLDWLAHRRAFNEHRGWVHRVAWRASWAVQRRQGNVWNRYAQRCRDRDETKLVQCVVCDEWADATTLWKFRHATLGDVYAHPDGRHHAVEIQDAAIRAARLQDSGQ